MEKTIPLPRLIHGFWTGMLLISLVALGIGITFWLSGPEMIVLTMLFGGGFMVLESVGQVFSGSDKQFL